MEANNGYEYRVVKFRTWAGGVDRATRRAVVRAEAEGWEVVRAFPLEGVPFTQALALRRAPEARLGPEGARAAAGSVFAS